MSLVLNRRAALLAATVVFAAPALAQSPQVVRVGVTPARTPRFWKR
jgi:hypothetical protein